MRSRSGIAASEGSDRDHRAPTRRANGADSLPACHHRAKGNSSRAKGYGSRDTSQRSRGVIEAPSGRDARQSYDEATGIARSVKGSARAPYERQNVLDIGSSFYLNAAEILL